METPRPTQTPTFYVQRLSRRKLLTGAATTAAGIVLTTLPDWYTNACAAQEQEQQANAPRKIGPNDTIQVAGIGLGGSTPGSFKQGLSDTRAVATQKGTKVVAVCDVDMLHLSEAGMAFKGAKKYADFREIVARPDIDAVVIGTPDHWHAVIAIAAMNAGKDVYCEKPMTLTIAEGRKMTDAARKNGRILQNGSQQRSDKRFRLACGLVRAGRIGKIKSVEANLPGARKGGPFEITAPPRQLLYDLWLGPAPETPYIKERTHGSFRYWYEYSGGMVTDWGAHHLDITQWGLNRDNSGPVKIESKGEPPPPDPTNRSYNVHPAFEIVYTYDDGVTVTAANRGENGVKFIGETGWIFVSRGRIEASDPAILLEPESGDGSAPGGVYVSNNHAGNFVDCIRSRQLPICDVEVGHRSATVCHLGNLSLRLGRTLNWDPKKEEFTNGDREANAMRDRARRAPWGIA
jgi:predicted dehydrogenase